MGFRYRSFGHALIVAVKKLHRKLPAAMLVVIASIVGIYFFSGDSPSVTLLGAIPEGLPQFQLHNFQISQWTKALPLALALAFIAFAEAMSMAKAVEEKSQEFYTDANQELRALGIANIVGSFFQSFPTNAGLSRTAVNVEEGAKTSLASIISVLVVAATLLFLTGYFQYLPKTVLGAIILVAVFGLIDVKLPQKLAKQQWDEFILWMVTF